MKLYPNCKINLGLNIVGRREDGYHNIETIFLPIPLADCLEIETASLCDEFQIDGQPLDCTADDNLVMKVLRLLRHEAYDVPPVKVSLTKNIPSGAGLGGGSTDAAFMMKGLNQMFDLGISIEGMQKLVGKLGADCPLFICNLPVYAEGIGDRFCELPVALMKKTFNLLPPTGPFLPPSAELSIPATLHGCWLVLIKPNVFVSTREAYQGVTPQSSTHKLTDIIRQPVKQWRGLMVNDFEKTVFATHPRLAEIHSELYTLGANYVAMSGSGSTIYGIFAKRPQLGNVFEASFQWMCQL